MVVLDRCRVRSGKVLTVEGDLVTVQSRALVFEGHQLVEGPERLESVRRSVEGLGFVRDLSPGDNVAMHWDWVCGRLSAGALERLRSWTVKSLNAVNCTATPGPAVACDWRGA
jgi:hypothetical protein